MKKNFFYPSAGFTAVFVAHVLYSRWQSIRISKLWVKVHKVNWFSGYLENQDYFLGLAYGLAVAFTIYALLKFLEGNRNLIGGMAGGITLTGLIYVGGCFLVGCCGSPMLAVYLSLFGSTFLGFTKPLVFVITLTSVVIGYVWINRETKAQDECCPEHELQAEELP